MMPPVGVLVPIYLIFRDAGLLDTRSGLVFILCLGNLPIVVWMLFTYFKEIPRDILEAARMDGATIGREISTSSRRWRFRVSPRRCSSTSSSPGTKHSGR